MTKCLVRSCKSGEHIISYQLIDSKEITKDRNNLYMCRYCIMELIDHIGYSNGIQEMMVQRAVLKELN